MNRVVALERDRAIAVEFELVFPLRRIVRESIGGEQQHRLDEAGFDARGHQPSLYGEARQLPTPKFPTPN